jgi:uncharacterized membrane protein
MKTYRVSRLWRWSRISAKVVLTVAAAFLYYFAVSHPTPLAFRLSLLAGIALFGYLFYVRLPRVPTEVTITQDGLVSFRSRRGTMQIPAGEIRAIGRSFGRRTLKVEYDGGVVRLPNRFRRLLDLLLTLKGLNPAIDIRWA